MDEDAYHKFHLEGHEHAVRALNGRGQTLVPGSYDTHVRVWDIITGECNPYRPCAERVAPYYIIGPYGYYYTVAVLSLRWGP